MAASKLLLAVLFLVPAAAAEVPLFRFVQISDTHIGNAPDREATLNDIVARINAMAELPAFVLVTGDLTENGLASEYTTFKSILAKLHPAVARHYVPGNHETVSGTWSDYQAAIGPLTESFTVSNCLFILTNGTRDDKTYHHDGLIDAAQLQWIEDQLKGSLSKTHVVMADHFPLGTQWGLYSVVDPAMSTLQGWMKSYKVTAWLNGHRHFDAFYADTAYQTSHILCGATTGASGFAGPGYRLNTVYPDRIESERVKVYGGTDPRFVEPAPYVCPNPRWTGGTPPTITAHPVDQTVSVGGTATFSVAATGSAPLSYQWQRNGVNLAGATGSTYTTPAATTADDGAVFRCLATNGSGVATSLTAVLTVTTPVSAPRSPTSDPDDTFCGALGLEGLLLAWLGSRRGRGRIFRF